MAEITINGIEYIVHGDYPNGRYVKHIKNKGTPVEPGPTIEDRLIAIEAALGKLTTLETKIDAIKSQTAKVV